MSSHQAANEMASLVDLEDLICGLTILGTGGGGRPEAGRAALAPLLEAGARLVWTSLESLPDGGTYCSLGGLGSIAPIEPLGDDERQAAGYPLEMIPEQPMVVAARALQGLVGRTIDGVYPVELGAGNSTTTLAAGAEPRIDRELLGQYHAGLIVLSGDSGGEAAFRFAKGDDGRWSVG